MEQLTSSLEDYLEIIFNKLKKDNEIKAVNIAKELQISRASVSEALKKLEKKGYITYGHYGKISLTDLGTEAAEKISSKHIKLQIFFEKVLNLSQKEASENACNIEHIISDNAFEKIVQFTEGYIKN